MHIFQKVEDLQSHLSKVRKKGLQVGFVPTMGALHQGHLSLIKRAQEGSQYTVCSIFVNPTQFNNASDLEKYPRTTGADIQLLNEVSTDVLFLPTVKEVYPPGLDTSLSLNFADLDQVMEGAFRPGHFEGMAQVVNRLLEIVQPQQLYMGQKDFQQFSIVQSMLDQLNSDIELVMCPIIREEDGLAMSSRNRRLTPEHREKAVLLSQTLRKAEQMFQSEPARAVEKWAMAQFNQPGFKAEYFSIVDGRTLQPVDKTTDSDFIVACTAVWLGEIRLIDNIIIKSPFSQA